MTDTALGTSAALAATETLESPARRAWRRLVRHKGAMLGLAVIAIFILLAVFAPMIVPYDPIAASWSLVRKAPSAQHWFGTDELGRDVLARVVFGARASLLAGLISVSIALAIGVPGTVAGLALALEKYGSGKFTLAQILKPAIDLARDGFIVTDDTSDTLSDMYRRMSRWPNSARAFSHADGTPLHEGDRLIQGDLAGVLTAIAEQGPRGFYEGAVAEKLVSGIKNAGGIFTLADLKSYQPVIRAPIRGSYRGHDIVSMPQPSSGGVVLLEILNILEGFPMSDMKQGSAASLHVMIEAMKRAYADRARYLGDPAFVDAPTQLLVDKDYAARQRATIDLARATPWTDVRNAKQPHEGDNTTHYSVVDEIGRAHV